MPRTTHWSPLQRLLMVTLIMLFVVGCVYRKSIKQGDEYYESGQYEQALTEYQRALEKKPDSEEAQMRVSDAKSALVREYTAEARKHLDAAEYAEAIGDYTELKQRLPREPAVDQLGRDISNSAQLRASQAAEESDWARSLELLMLVYDTFSEDRDVLDPEIRRVKKAWADALMAKAAEVEQSEGGAGDALLLYSKTAELVMTPKAVSKRDELRAKLLDTHTYDVRLKGRGPGFKIVAGALKESEYVPNVSFSSAAIDDPNAVVEMEVGRPRFAKDRQSTTRTKRYKSGTRMVQNPRYESLERDVLREERDLQRYQEDVTRYQRDVSRYQSQVSREGPSPNTSTGAEQSLSRAQSSLERARDNVDRARDDVIRAKERLAREPQMIEEDVYSDLNYTVYTHTLIGELPLTLRVTHPDGRERIPFEATLTVSASDTEHAAYPVANVPEDRLDLPGKGVLENDLYVSATNQTWKTVDQSLQEYRQGMLEQAFAKEDTSERMHMYVVYILLDPTQVNPQVPAEIASKRGIPGSVDLLAAPVQ